MEFDPVYEGNADSSEFAPFYTKNMQITQNLTMALCDVEMLIHVLIIFSSEHYWKLDHPALVCKVPG